LNNGVEAARDEDESGAIEGTDDTSACCVCVVQNAIRSRNCVSALAVAGDGSEEITELERASVARETGAAFEDDRRAKVLVEEFLCVSSFTCSNFAIISRE
jgi:hypothetical protein